jgi:uncharacterized membrane protein
MHGSTFLPWLLIGPIFLGIACMLLYQFSGLAVFATAGKICAVFALAVIVLAVGAGLRALQRMRTRGKSDE